MCLAVPMEIIDLLPENKAVVEQGSIRIEADISLLEEPQVGDFVIVHAGFAIETVDEAEAAHQLDVYEALQDGASPDSER